VNFYLLRPRWEEDSVEFHCSMYRTPNNGKVSRE
jgi:hypothetical protein